MVSPFYGNVDVVGAYGKARAQNAELDNMDFRQHVALAELLQRKQYASLKERELGIEERKLNAPKTFAPPEIQVVTEALAKMAPGDPMRPYYEARAKALGPRPEKVAESKAPPMRTRIVGEQSVQEEYQADGTWKEVGRGPRFGKQVVNVNAPSKEALTPEAVRDLAVQSLYDQQVLAGYRRDTTAMSRIANERLKVMKEAGITSEDVVGGRAGFKADTASLNKITPQYDAIRAFEQTAIRNGKILKELADKVDATGIPVAERWIRAGRVATGDADVAKFNAQMNLYRAEAARILTQPNLSGVLTDTARQEMEHVLRNQASAKQVREVVDLLERDFKNREETLADQIGAIRNRMRARQGPGANQAIPGQEPKPAAAGAVPEFATEEEAIKSGVKGKVKIGGRNATIN